MSKLHLILLYAISAIIFLPGQSCKAQIDTKLPESMPRNIAIRFQENAGMLLDITKIEIQTDSTIIEKVHYKTGTTYKSFLTDTILLKELYSLFYKNKFDLIKNITPEDLVYDAGYENISITADKVLHNVSYGANHGFENEEDASKYLTIRKKIMDFYKESDK